MARLDEIKSLPSVAALRAALSYDAETGELTWKVRQGSCAAGKRAGTIATHGYVVVLFKRTPYLAHRLIWKMVTGEDPTTLIDHANRIKGDNRWVNLREAGLNENRWNSILPRNNTSGFKGVHFCPLHRKWRAIISANRRTKHVGYYATPEEASAARSKVAVDLHGDFARAG
jgi:hypothetical protein